MSEAILLSLWIGTSLFFIIREIKAKSDKERHEFWISELRDCLHRIESEFCRECEDLAKNLFLQYNKLLRAALLDEIHKFKNSIDETKKLYIDNVYDKVIEKGMSRYTLTTIPEYLATEYERNIKDITDTFWNYGQLMWEQVI